MTAIQKMWQSNPERAQAVLFAACRRELGYYEEGHPNFMDPEIERRFPSHRGRSNLDRPRRAPIEGDEVMQEPSAPTKRMAEILGAQFVPKETNPTQPSQAAREDVDSGMSGAAVERAEIFWANLPRVPKWTSLHTHEKALVCHTLARFERDTEKRIRESLAGEANVERVAKVLHRYDEPTVGWADPMEVHNAR